MSAQAADLLPWWWAVIIFNTILVFGPIVIDWCRDRLDLLNCRHIFVLFLWLQFCIWPAWVLLAGYDSFNSIHIYFIDEYAAETLPGLLFATLALVCFYAGYFLVPKLRLASAQQFLLVKLGWRFSFALKWVSLLYAALGIMAGLAFLRAAGGWQVIFHLDEFRTTNLAGFGPYFMGLNFLGFAALLYYYRSAMARRFPWKALFIFSLAIGFAAVCGYRHMMLGCLIYIAVVRHYLVRQFRLNATSLLLATAFVLANLAYVSFRSTGSPLLMFSQMQDSADLAWRGFFSRFHGIESMVRIMHVTGKEGHLGLGRAAEDFFNSFVPRKLFPNKPSSLGIVVNLEFFGDYFKEGDTGACVATLLGDLYWLGGISAIVVGTFCLGMGARWARQLLYHVRHRPFAIMLYAQIYIFYFFVNDDFFLHWPQLVQRCILMFLPLILSYLTFKRPGSRKGIPAQRNNVSPCAS